MPTTPNRAYPYQGRTDTPHGPDLGKNLALAVDADVAALLARLNTAVDVQNITATGNWTKPAGATGAKVRVQCWGGGGAGGGAATTAGGQASAGGGGQAGGYAERWFSADDLSATEAVTIGAGGTGGTGAGPAGGDTTFSSAGKLVQGGGGNGGAAAAASGVFGITGQTTVAQTNTGTITGRGAPGVWGIRNGPDAIGAGGMGGSSTLGGGGGAGQNVAGVAGEANSGGGGGGSGNSASQSAKNGGNGGSGRCIVTTFFT